MDNQLLKEYSAEMKCLALNAVHRANSGHPGGSLSASDIIAALYFKHLNIDPANPSKPDRDRFVLSKGHAAPIYYAALALKGYFKQADLLTLRSINSHLQGHPCMNKTPGVDFSTGSLGQGLSAANGMALAAKLDKLNYYVYCICGDGEIQEGQIWEAAMTAAHYKLNNLILFIDANGLQIDGKVEAVMNNAPIGEKFKAFGWQVIEINGHDFDEINAAIEKAKRSEAVPTCILAKTIKGAGVSFMANQASWHGSAPNDEQLKQALKEIKEGIR